MKAIFILMDSLNRDYLAAYGNTWVKTPNLDRLARNSIVFDNHFIGSAPCMPARRDILTGRLNFLEREWSGLEPFDVPFPKLLKAAGVFSHMETDHYHYFHVGGENYHMPFDTWAFHRGQEYDGYISRVMSLEEPEHLGEWSASYEKNRSSFKTDADYSTPKTFSGATQWLRANQGSDNYFLWVEAFDPHEPFDCPKEFTDQYEDRWEGPHYNWSGYERVEEHSEATAHLQKLYASTLTMADKWLGKLLDEVERQNGFDDTLIILTTDHGHMLGERGRTGKRRWHAWNELAHIPLFVHLPGSLHAGERRSQLTQNIDIMPTLMDFFSSPFDAPINGVSWTDILHKNAPSKKEGALYGWFGQSVNVTDGSCTYFRAAAHKNNQPLNRYFLMPTKISYHDLPDRSFFENAEIGNFLTYTDYPVMRVNVKKSEVGTYRRVIPGPREWEETMLFDLRNDPGQTKNIAGTAIEEKYGELLASELKRVGAPLEQFERLGLPGPT
jgi:arylsulfatase A-like enzyme